MAVLSEELQQRIRQAPTARLPVTITVEPGTTAAAVPELSRAAPIVGLAGIYQGTLTGQQLLTLAQQPAVLSIEPDGEAVIL